MSVSMLIENLETGERELVPVATQDTYSKVWVKGGMEIGLQMVPAFDGPLGCGVDIDQYNMTELIDELERLSIWVSSQQNPPYRTGLFEKFLGYCRRSAIRRWNAYQAEFPKRVSTIRAKLESLDLKKEKYSVSIG